MTTDAYQELYVYTMGRRNFILQHVVDANIAQKAPAMNPPPIGVIFALAGLYLYVERGFTGTQVQSAHRVMGNAKRPWPDIEWPAERGTITAEEVLAAQPGPDRDARIAAWCKEVWSAFSANRGMLVALLAEYKIIERVADS